MKTAIPWILLAISAGVNSFFFAGIVFAPPRMVRPPRGPEGRVEMLSRELGLKPDQKTRFLELEKEFMDKRIARENRETAALDKVITELTKTEPDEAAIKAFLDTDASDGPKHHLVNHLRSMMTALDADQRARAADLFRRSLCRGFGPGCGPGQDGGRPPFGPGRGPGHGPGGGRPAGYGPLDRGE